MVAVIALFVALGGTPLAKPVRDAASSLATQVKKALKTGKRADKRAKKAIKRAAEARSLAQQALAGQGSFYSKDLSDARFLLKGEKAADSNTLDGIDSTGFLAVGGKAADADKLDGIDSTGFLAANGKAVDADKLDNIDSTAFLQGAGAIPGGSDLAGTYTSPTIGSGKVTAGKFAQLPAVRATHDAGQTVNNATNLEFLFKVDRFDQGGSGIGLHCACVTDDGKRLVAPIDGVYVITANVQWPNTDVDGSRHLHIRRFNSDDSNPTFIASDIRTASQTTETYQTVSTIARLSANQYVKLIGFQDSGSNLDVGSVAERSPEFAMTWLSP